MSNKNTPYHLRDVNKPPRHLNSSQKQSWIKTAEKAKRNYQLRQQYPPFNIPDVMYQVMYINKYTTYDTMDLLMKHAEECSEYSIDTEGEKETHETALIQIESIPRKLPKYIIILELAHLPLNNSSTQELLKVTQEDLLCPIKAVQYDIQALFSNWFLWARSQCEGCGLSNDSQCHEPSPYRWTELWSLQNALIYVSGVFIDKAITVNNWSSLLDPVHSTLSRTTHEQRIRYLINDCLATTYFSKAVVEYWTFDKLTKTNFTELFTSSSTNSSIINNNNIRITIKNSPRSTQKIKNNIDGQIFKNALDNGLEFISDESGVEEVSDEEINLNQLIKPNVIKKLQDDIIIDDEPIERIQQHEIDPFNNDLLNKNELIVNEYYMVVDVTDEEEQLPTEQRKNYKNKSAQARQRKNKKRNKKMKRRRYYYLIKRDWYPRFPTLIIRKILRLYNVSFTHVKDEGDKLKIGLTSRSSQRTAERQLPWNIFNRRSYFYYQRLFRR